MGASYKAFCRGCGHTWSQTDGGGFTFTQVVCGNCGNSQYRPRCAPANCPPMSRSALQRFVRDSEPPWEESGRAFTHDELVLMEAMFACCSCGGNLYPEGHKRARTRCPECLSTDITRGPMDALFD